MMFIHFSQQKAPSPDGDGAFLSALRQILPAPLSDDQAFTAIPFVTVYLTPSIVTVPVD